MPKPNILYLHSHDTGRYVEPYGYKIATPNMQRFAEQGVVFRQAFCANPTCSPSRASLLTGMYPHVNGMMGLAHRGFKLNDPKQHLAHFLKDAGYETVLCGMHHETGDIHSIGYERSIALPPATAENVAPIACEFLKAKHERPFFLSVGFHETHREFPPAQVDERYVRPPAPIPDAPETRRDMAEYATSAAIMDDAYGKVLAALDEAGLAGDTLVIMTTDHGPAFPAMKCSLTDHGIGVLLIVRGPGGFAGGRVIDAMVSHMDVFPTICDLAGLEKPDRLQGKSILPLIRGDVNRLHDQIVCEVNFHASYEPQRSVRTDRYKYIRRFGERAKPVLPNCDAGYAKTVWLDAGWADTDVPTEQLYDLVFDPNETNNLADRPGFSSILEPMRERLSRWMRETRDPLLDGPLFAPPGSCVNDVDALEPDSNVIRFPNGQRM